MEKMRERVFNSLDFYKSYGVVAANSCDLNINHFSEGAKMKRKYFVAVTVVVVCSAFAGAVQADWLERQKLTASDGAENDVFGRSVSISGDYAIVGVVWR